MKVFDYFEEICKIPHCSFDTDGLKDYLGNFLKEKGYSLNIDKYGNIHAFKGDPKICLQAHYDMVCVGLAPRLNIIKKDGFLSANQSSLGADNGIGVAIIMEIANDCNDLEILLTNNEEVGLLGANGFEGRLKSKRLLNLDSEDENGVFIGCAGGVTAILNSNLDFINDSGDIYEVSVFGLQGGHSGVDIMKEIPNALKILCQYLQNNSCELISLNGGERNNSIPVNATSVVISKNKLIETKHIKVHFLGKKEVKKLAISSQIINLVNAFCQGIRSYDENLGLPTQSVNLSTIKQSEDIKIEFLARSMSNDGLIKLKNEMQSLANLANFNVEFKNQDNAWNPKITQFSNIVLEKLKKVNDKAKFMAIHAGLECGVLLKNADELEVCSIGPNIYFPHSINEKVEINSVLRIKNLVKEILAVNFK